MEACHSNHWDLGCEDAEESLHPWEKECEEVVMTLGCGIQVKGVGQGHKIVPKGGKAQTRTQTANHW